MKLLRLLPALALAACATPEVFTPPAAPAEPRFTDQTLAIEAAGAAPADCPPVAPGVPAQCVEPGVALRGDWWSVFHAPALDALVRQALAANPGVREAAASLAQAEEFVRARSGQSQPQLALQAGIGREKYGAEFLGSLTKPPPFGYFAVGPTVSYTVDLAGSEAHGIARQRALAEIRRHQRTAAQLALSGNVVIQALTVAALEQQITSVERLLAFDRQAQALTGAAQRSGAVSDAEPLASAAELAGDATLLPPLRQDLARARHALAILIGQSPSQALPPLPSLADLSLPARVPIGLPSELAHRRPDILAAEADLQVAAESVGVASAALYPQLTLTASGGLQSTDPGHFFDPASTVFSLAAGLSAPLWNGGRLRAEQRAAVDAAQASAARYENTVLQAFAQVADALEILGADAEAVAAQALLRANAEASVALARRAVLAGSGTLQQQLDAQRAGARVVLAAQRSEAQRLIDTAQLLLALGGSGEETFATR